MAAPGLTAIILTRDEELHIERCIRSLEGIASQIFVVDSGSTDRTVEIARSLGAVVVHRRWKNYADQFQWALDHYAEHCGGPTEWVMRMDADECLEADLAKEIPEALACAPKDLAGFYIRRKVFFMGKWIRWGGFYPHVLLRIWRHSLGRIEQRWMDEHIVLPPGAKTRMLRGHLVDDNRKGLTFWIDKHNRYASREAVDLLSLRYPLLPQRDEALKELDDPQAKWKRLLKEEVYARLPLGLRATLYFLYRYLFRLGFLDGGKGFIWHFLQGYWYRLLVDAKIMEILEKSGGDVERMKDILAEEHGIDLREAS